MMDKIFNEIWEVLDFNKDEKTGGFSKELLDYYRKRIKKVLEAGLQLETKKAEVRGRIEGEVGGLQVLLSKDYKLVVPDYLRKMLEKRLEKGKKILAELQAQEEEKNCYCGGPEEIYPHKLGTGRYCSKPVAQSGESK